MIVHSNISGNNREWDEYVHAIGERWKKTIVEWFIKSANFSRPVMVVRYEDIKANCATQVERMLNFLDFPFDKAELTAKLNNRFENFKRRHKEQFEHYTVAQKKYVNMMLLDTIKTLTQHKLEHFFKLDDYLDSY